MVEEEGKKGDKRRGPSKRGARGYRKILFATRTAARTTRATRKGWQKRVAKCRGIGNRRLVEGVGRGFGRHGDKQPPGPSQLVAGVGRKGWPRASAGQVRLGTQPECHSVQGNTRMSFGRDGEQSECDEEGGGGGGGRKRKTRRTRRTRRWR